MLRRIARRYTCRRLLFLSGCVYILTSVWILFNLEDSDQTPRAVSNFFTRINDPFGNRNQRRINFLDPREIQINGIQPTVFFRHYEDKQTWGRCYSNIGNYSADIMVTEEVKIKGGWLQTSEKYFVMHTKRTLDLIVKKLMENQKWKFVWSEAVFLNWWWTKATQEQRANLKTYIVTHHAIRDHLESVKFIDPGQNVDSVQQCVQDDKTLAKVQNGTQLCTKLRLLQSGQLELMTGGWVMPDEATTHYSALIDQLTEGHQWIKNTFNITVTSSWAIDPFGHSSTMPYLFKRAGIQNMVIQRTHFAIKRLFAKEKSLEFIWKQQWEDHNRGILCHMMPFLLYSIPHSCGPDRHVCCKFDFHKRNCFQGTKRSEVVEVTDENVADLSSELWEQLQKKSELYRSHVMLLPHGDDFRYDTEAEWNKQLTNMEKLMIYLNSNEKFKVKIEFGTVSDYFLALRREHPSYPIEKRFPSLSGDFLTYSDRGDQYWSGIYTTRPHLKGLIRQLQYRLRLAEFMFLFSHGDSNLINDTYSRMESIRRTLAIHQHHDAITGTSRKHVIKDYIQKLNSSIAEAQRIYFKTLNYLIMKNCSKNRNQNTGLLKSLTDRKTLQNKPIEEVYLSIPPFSNVTVLISNILGWNRVEVVNVTLNTSRVCVSDVDGRPVRYQISPVWKGDGTFMKDKYRLSFEVHIEPFTVKPYVIKHEADESHNDFVTNLKYYRPNLKYYRPNLNNYRPNLNNYRPNNQTINRSRLKDDIFKISYTNNEVIKLTNQFLSAIVTAEYGLLKYVYHHDKNTLYRSDAHFVTYSTGRNSHPFIDKSGAYTFVPDGVAKLFTEIPISVVIINGPVFSQVRTTYQSITHIVTVFKSPGPRAHGVQVENVVDINNDYWNNRELAVRIETDIFNEDHTFCTDVNGFQLQRRKTRAKMTIQGNFHPVTTIALTENEDARFTLLTTNVHGVASLVSGWIEAMLDRRLIQDDWRGLSEIVTDNVPVTSSFFLLFEERVGEHNKVTRNKDNCLPSSLADTLSEELNNPLAIFDIASTTSGPCVSRIVLARGLPCRYHIINFRMLPRTHDMKEALIFIHHRATDCGFTTTRECNNKVSWSFKDISSLIITEVKETSLTGTEVKRLLKPDEPIRIDPMEIKTYKIVFK